MIAAAVVAGSCFLVLALPGCRGPQDRMNSVQRAAWDREKSEARTEWQRAEAELWAIEERAREVREKTALAASELRVARAREAERARELQVGLQVLAAMEQDLVAAAKRREQIEVELAELARQTALDALEMARRAAMAVARVRELEREVEKPEEKKPKPEVVQDGK